MAAERRQFLSFAPTPDHRSEIDLVLCDVNMPEQMGPEVIRELKEIKPELGCIFMTGGDTGEYTTRDLLQCGAKRVLSKPFSIETLVQSIEAVS